MHFDLIVVTISLKMCVKDRRDRSRSIARKEDFIIMYRSALASGLLTSWSTFTKWQIIFKPLNGFFWKKLRFLPMKRHFKRNLSLNVIDMLKGSKKSQGLRFANL